MESGPLIEHFFRHEYGRLVSILASRFGLTYIQDIEDAVQSALLTALNTWTQKGILKNPTGWLFRVAQNNLLGELRQRHDRSKLLEKERDQAPPMDAEDGLDPVSVEDDLLRMLFACCGDAISSESQLTLALKTLCGFSVREIALRLFTSEANIYKRLNRAQNRLRELNFRPIELSDQELSLRLPGVRQILYLLFTEGYLSVHHDETIRRELCDEAIRLTTLLANHPIGQEPETHALLALMHLHLARFGSRQTPSGGLLLLEEQDRSFWNKEAIARGLSWLAKSARGTYFSRFHAEAGIAAEHCLAASFQETRWDRIVETYSLLERVTPSPLHTLKRAVAMAEWKGPDTALALLHESPTPSWLKGTFLEASVLADLNHRCGHKEEATRQLNIAIKTAPTKALERLVQHRLEKQSP